MKRILIAGINTNELASYESALVEPNYNVLKAADSGELLKKYRSELERSLASRSEGSAAAVLPFDAVILNHTASLNEDGLQAAREILSVNPRQRIVFVSDSDGCTTELQKEFYGRVEVIQKPFEHKALIELIESAEVYRALEKLGLNMQKLKECNLHHFQLQDLLAACITLLEAQSGNGK
ncbi:MAG TPA: response regulator [Nitrososphaera sp.]|nr:response regulator [Nitrososphaera sp.]